MRWSSRKMRGARTKRRRTKGRRRRSHLLVRIEICLGNDVGLAYIIL